MTRRIIVEHELMHAEQLRHANHEVVERVDRLPQPVFRARREDREE